MSTTFTEGLKERFAGQLSENELVLCSSLQKIFRVALDGQIDFEAVMVFLSIELRTLRKFSYDVEAAVESGEFDPTLKRWFNSDRQPVIALLSDDERAFFEDSLGLTEWVVRNGVSFTLLLEVLGHDIGEISHHEFSLPKTLADFVKPKVSGWAKRNTEPVGESIEQG